MSAIYRWKRELGNAERIWLHATTYIDIVRALHMRMNVPEGNHCIKMDELVFLSLIQKC